MAENTADTPNSGEESAEDQNQAAVRVVQAMIVESVKSAVAGATQEILKVVEEKLSAQSPAATTTTATGALPVSGGASSLPSGGQIPPAAGWAGISVLSTAPSTWSGTVPSGAMSRGPAAPQQRLGNERTLSPATPLMSLLPLATAPQSAEAVTVGSHSPPIPKKLAAKIWEGEFVELSELLPCRLGAPELTLLDLMSGRDKPKEARKITNIQQWVVCFNSFTSVMAVRHPERVRHLLAYAAIITKASLDYEGVPWLVYDSHFRRVAAASKLQDWSQVDASLWTLYFTSATRSSGTTGGLSVVPMSTEEPEQEANPAPERRGKSVQRGSNRPTPYTWICMRWNFQGCRDARCKYRHVCVHCRSPSHASREGICPNQPKDGARGPPDSPGHSFRGEGPGKGQRK